MIKIHYEGRPVSKSNNYRFGKGIVWRSKDVVIFEKAIVSLFTKALLYPIQWDIPGNKTLLTEKGNPRRQRPSNALYPKGTDVSVHITYHTLKKTLDIDGPIKSILDAITKAGVWYDDAQVKDVHAIRVPSDKDAIDVTITKYEKGNYRPSPLTRKEWWAQDRAEEPREPIVISVICQECGIGVGRGLPDDEIWLLPKKSRYHWIGVPICGSCANHMHLDIKYRLVVKSEIYSLSHWKIAILTQRRKKEMLKVINGSNNTTSNRNSTRRGKAPSFKQGSWRGTYLQYKSRRICYSTGRSR